AAEPTDLGVDIARKGTVRWRCHTIGRAAHSSAPEAGENAIYRMQPVVLALQKYADSLADRQADPLLGRPTLSVGTIHGGLTVNTVPDRCTIQIDRRVLPDESPAAAYDEVVRFVAERAADGSPQHDAPFLTSPGLAAGANERLAEALAACVRQHG